MGRVRRAGTRTVEGRVGGEESVMSFEEFSISEVEARGEEGGKRDIALQA